MAICRWNDTISFCFFLFVCLFLDLWGSWPTLFISEHQPGHPLSPPWKRCPQKGQVCNSMECSVTTAPPPPTPPPCHPVFKGSSFKKSCSAVVEQITLWRGSSIRTQIRFPTWHIVFKGFSFATAVTRIWSLAPEPHVT